MNDIPPLVTCKLTLYADDPTLIVPGKTCLEMQDKLSAELESVREWLIDKLSLHLGKTESILFGSKRKLLKSNSSKVKCDGKTLAGSANMKYRVDLVQALSGDRTVSKIISLANAKLKFLYRQARGLDKGIKKLLVSALIQCQFDYASSAGYTGLTQKLKQRLQCTQNEIIRYLLNAPAKSHIGSHEFGQVQL